MCPESTAEGYKHRERQRIPHDLVALSDEKEESFPLATKTALHTANSARRINHLFTVVFMCCGCFPVTMTRSRQMADVIWFYLKLNFG